MNNKTKCEVEGSNLVQFINLCSNNNIVLENVNKKSISLLTFEINDNYLKKLKSIDISNYKLTIIRYGGIRNIISIFLNRIGLIVGLMIALVLWVLSNNRLFTIHIYGLSSINKNDVICKISDFGIRKMQLMQFDSSKLEEYLVNEFDFSLVSVIKKGNSLIISVKEGLPDVNDGIVPIYAEFDMVIKSIDVYAGTGMVKCGDVVKKGDLLVDSYYLEEDKKIAIKPCAKIMAETYVSQMYEFRHVEEILVRTGEKEIIDSCVYLGKFKLIEKNKDCSFSLYEEEFTQSLVSNYFLPIKIGKTISYKLENKQIEHDYESEKDSILTTLKEDCYNMLSQGLNVREEKVTVTEMNFGKIITMCLICDVEYNYK